MPAEIDSADYAGSRRGKHGLSWKKQTNLTFWNAYEGVVIY